MSLYSKFTVLPYVTPCNMVENFQTFGGTHTLYHQDWRIFLYRRNWHNRFVRNAGKFSTRLYDITSHNTVYPSRTVLHDSHQISCHTGRSAVARFNTGVLRQIISPKYKQFGNQTVQQREWVNNSAHARRCKGMDILHYQHHLKDPMQNDSDIREQTQCSSCRNFIKCLHNSFGFKTIKWGHRKTRRDCDSIWSLAGLKQLQNSSQNFNYILYTSTEDGMRGGSEVSTYLKISEILRCDSLR